MASANFASSSSSRGFSDRYILVNHQPVRCDDVVIWGRWFENNDHVMFKDSVNGIRVSTVFLAIDHSYGAGHPVLFETMIFGGEDFDGKQYRYENYEEAKRGHEQTVGMLVEYFRSGIKIDNNISGRKTDSKKKLKVFGLW